MTAIPKSLQLVAGKTAREFNRRKNRNGAYWEDRYHATAIETGEHLFRYLVYIDLNRLRNGVVDHPPAWIHGGYNEIQDPPSRYSLIDRERLITCCCLESDEILRKEHRQWVEESIHNGGNARQPAWTESIAVGTKKFVDEIRKTLQPRITDRKETGAGDHYELREHGATYKSHFWPKNGRLSTGNAFYSDLNSE